MEKKRIQEEARIYRRDFPGDPVVKTLCLQCKEWRFSPCREIKYLVLLSALRASARAPCCYHCNLQLHLLKGHCWGRGVWGKIKQSYFGVHLREAVWTASKRSCQGDQKLTRKQQIGARMTSGNGRSPENSGNIGRDPEISLKWRKGIWVKLKGPHNLIKLRVWDKEGC